MQIFFFEKSGCSTCKQFLATVLHYVKEAGREQDMTRIDIETEEGLTQFSNMEMGKIPGLLILRDEHTEDTDPLLKWNGRADWMELQKVLKGEG